MARPGFVYEVSDRTPPLAVHNGAGIVSQSFPLGTKVVYAAEPVTPSRDLRVAVREALASPVGAGAPLADRLRPGQRVAIVFGDTSSAVPPMQLPDARGQVIEEILTLAARAGVDEVALVCARGLNRRLSEAELAEAVGSRVHESFAPIGRLLQHDATASDLVEIAGARIDATVAGADLVVLVQATDQIGRTGTALLAELASEADLATVRGPQADPGAEGDLADRIAAAMDVFTVQVALDTHPFAPELGFLNKREWEWSLRDQAVATGLRTARRFVPERARARMFQQTHTTAAVLAVAAGAPDAAGTQVASALRQRQLVGVAEQVDVLVTGIPHVSPYGVGAWLNPLLAAHLALHDAFGSHTGTPLVAAGGAMIIFGDVPPRFHRHHVASADFFSEVLPQGRSVSEVAAKEELFASDDWYRHLYRESEAHHARQPFHLWYEMEPARQHLGSVIWVGGDRAVCAALGFRAATTLADALEMVDGETIGHLHAPPVPLVDLGGV